MLETPTYHFIPYTAFIYPPAINIYSKSASEAEQTTEVGLPASYVKFESNLT